MKTASKIIATLVLTLLTLSMCSVVIVVLLFGLWLRTYNAFTQEKLVATITAKEIEPVGGLARMQVRYEPVATPSALDSFLFAGNTSDTAPQVQDFTLYGDQLLVGGPVVKFENIPVLLGFETVYKVSRIQGSFIDTVKANNIPSGNVYDINGGLDETWKHFERDSESLPWLVDTAYFSLAGKSAQDEPVMYGLYITEDGFVLDRMVNGQ